MEDLLNGKAFDTQIDEQIIFNQLGNKESAVWSLLIAGGYLRVNRFYTDEQGRANYELALANHEAALMFRQMADDWFMEYTLEAKGISPERIRKYGLAFEGKNVLIG